MKVLIVLALAALACADKVRVKGVYEKADFEAYKAAFGKSYHPKEELMRHEIYLNNIKEINAHNMLYDAGKSTYWQGVNAFSDWTEEELDRRNGFKPAPLTGPFHKMSGQILAESKDWRDEGAVNAIKDQGQCGSCWAFGTMASLESATFLKTGSLPNCSEQQLVSCDPYDSGCNGGLLETVFRYIKEQGDNGIDTQSSYPYTARDDACQDSKTQDGQDVAATCTGSTSLSGESSLQDAVATKGVISIAVAANSAFQRYSGGIFDDPNCTESLNHAVAAVGYNTSEGYWIVRNSWGSSWGDSGYIKMVMGKNMCGLSNMCTYPNV